MAHESFENSLTAEILNANFISIKVDREERPDIDSVYMTVCQAFTGNGGWPMSIFMTWDKKPFLAGTYFPVHSQYGMPGFTDLLHAVSERWKNNREELMYAADQVITHLNRTNAGHENGSDDDLCKKAVQMFSESFDSTDGGFGAAPKFPMPHNLLFLTRYAEQEDRPDVLKMVEKTLTQMRKGGIFDHVGYGFSRYSTDRHFLVPHFEKMLYDNALLIIAYAAASGISTEPSYLDTAEKIAEYVRREMTSLDGGFYSAQDADSEGIEGKYYTFTPTEIMEILGEEKGKRFSEIFDITVDGNFEGVNIPNLLKSNVLNADFDSEMEKLYSYRKNRASLHLDDKILFSWNSMMIAALSVLYRITGKEKYLQTAVTAHSFLEKNLCEDLQIYTSWRDGKRSERSFLDDYAFYIAALLELYHATLNGGYLEKAERFCMEAVKRFADEKSGGFYLSVPDDTELFMNPKESYDGAVPSGNSVMTYNLVRLYQLTEKEDYKKAVEKQICYMAAEARDYPTGYSMFLLAKSIYDAPPEHIVIALKNRADLERIKGQLPFLANVRVVSESEAYPLINDRTTFYSCRDHVCLAPTNEYGAICVNR